jgi:hypothetical protein
MLTLIEARPGAGKTTTLQRLAELLRERNTILSGFVTEEIRERGRRVGFSIETLGGERGTLAHQKLPGRPRVGRYGVAIGEFERLALPALRVAADAILIDELGRWSSHRSRSATTWRTWSEGTRPSWPPCTLFATRSAPRDLPTLRCAPFVLRAPASVAFQIGMKLRRHRTPALVLLVEAVSQTNGIGAEQQGLGEPPETDASGELLAASAGSGRLIYLDADRCSWRSITNNFRSVTFVKRPPSAAAANSGSPRICAVPAREAVECRDLATAEVVVVPQADADHAGTDPARRRLVTFA